MVDPAARFVAGAAQAAGRRGRAARSVRADAAFRDRPRTREIAGARAARDRGAQRSRLAAREGPAPRLGTHDRRSRRDRGRPARRTAALPDRAGEDAWLTAGVRRVGRNGWPPGVFLTHRTLRDGGRAGAAPVRRRLPGIEEALRRPARARDLAARRPRARLGAALRLLRAAHE